MNRPVILRCKITSIVGQLMWRAHRDAPLQRESELPDKLQFIIAVVTVQGNPFVKSAKNFIGKSLKFCLIIDIIWHIMNLMRKGTTFQLWRIHS